jgi:hypothetical protein
MSQQLLTDKDQRRQAYFARISTNIAIRPAGAATLPMVKSSRPGRSLRDGTAGRPPLPCPLSQQAL